MKKYWVGFFYALPVQLFLLHLRRYQVFLVFWYILFATVAGHFMETYGAASLFLAPEYLGNVNALSTAIVGFAIGIFVMSWNITTFILHSKHIRFLATTAQPFLKYCINNAIIPISFLVFYFFHAIEYERYRELNSTKDILLLTGGFTIGFILSVTIAFMYFFGADKTIYKRMYAVITTANEKYHQSVKRRRRPVGKIEIRVDWFLSARFHLRKPRDVRHYSEEFLDLIFKRHHFAAVFIVLFAFFFLIGVGFLSENMAFQIPAAASITLFFSIVIAVSAAFSLFLHSWSIPLLLLLYVALNWMYQHDIIDVRNKAYGLSYNSKIIRPEYDRKTILELADPVNVETDKTAFRQRLENWKSRQQHPKPILFLINVSGGGTRSATFTMNVLQRLDSITNGKLMQQTALITGASGGMLGAAYFRELYLQKLKSPAIRLQDKEYVDNISKDLLNPLFSSFISRDLVGPAKRFELNGQYYTKDRGYAFEQKLNENTNGILDKTIGDYTAPEDAALIPTMFFNSVISRDGRKMIIGSRPARFLMRNETDSSQLLNTDPDAIDFLSLFHAQHPRQLRVSSALRMNATFPYILPNVWLPTHPVIDVMDAGLRDNYGQETSLRFIQSFRNWLNENVSDVVLIQIRDRQLGDWERPVEQNSLLSFLTKPFLLLQNNWFHLQDYHQADQLGYVYDSFGPRFHRLCFQYVPSRKDAHASLSFHLNASEKKDIAEALDNPTNQKLFENFIKLLNK
ncbi:patatin-like phospholipase family protein [Filimonas effusa]|uniref:Patatin-like phospholipase family protein n=1 Tax=Filimonas effusa TaxID=2508721 RepID=A0A4Q1D1P0_9BACT|nr:patatin-like phospholipase family protein [Filimonas effusa]RXK80915.1 patatin-like phospholipase family protein [Filimonas effusa]